MRTIGLLLILLAAVHVARADDSEVGTFDVATLPAVSKDGTWVAVAEKSEYGSDVWASKSTTVVIHSIDALVQDDRYVVSCESTLGEGLTEEDTEIRKDPCAELNPNMETTSWVLKSGDYRPLTPTVVSGKKRVTVSGYEFRFRPDGDTQATVKVRKRRREVAQAQLYFGDSEGRESAGVTRVFVVPGNPPQAFIEARSFEVTRHEEEKQTGWTRIALGKRDPIVAAKSENAEELKERREIYSELRSEMLEDPAFKSHVKSTERMIAATCREAVALTRTYHELEECVQGDNCSTRRKKKLAAKYSRTSKAHKRSQAKLIRKLRRQSQKLERKHGNAKVFHWERFEAAVSDCYCALPGTIVSACE